MSRPSLGLVALALGSALAACHVYQAGSDDGGPIDGGAPPPDGPAADADPTCRAWHRVEGVVDRVVSLETTPLTMGRSVRFRIDVLACPGDTPGLVTAAPTFEHSFLFVDAVGWRSGPDCATPDVATSRVLTLEMPWSATWTIPAATEHAEVVVAEAPAGACGSSPPDACERDCDCASGEACLSGTDGGEPVQRCARPCELDRECGGEGRCGSDGGLDGVCVAGAECGADRPCPEGFACDGGACAPSFELNGGTRHECHCDAECGVGLRCVRTVTVEDPDYGRCEVICPTRSSDWCGPMHSCGPPAAVLGTAVCEWLGE